MLVNLSALTPTLREALQQLVRTIGEHDGVSPINESAELGLAGVRDADFFVLGSRSNPIGVVVCDPRDKTLMVGVHPEHRRQGFATELLQAARESYPRYCAWAFATLPGAPELAARVGLKPARELLRMQRPLAGIETAPADATIRSYLPGDAASIVALNAAAFADHPEQGRLTLAEFEQLTAQDWFDPAGLFVAEVDGELAGFHWTKRHGEGLGEVYVIAVAGKHEGRGLGRALLARGLAHLAEQGDQQVQLYVEANQTRVVELYRKAGFVAVQTDTAYRPEEDQA